VYYSQIDNLKYLAALPLVLQRRSSRLNVLEHKDRETLGHENQGMSPPQ
jgi:hypothetical protein